MKKLTLRKSSPESKSSKPKIVIKKSGLKSAKSPSMLSPSDLQTAKLDAHIKEGVPSFDEAAKRIAAENGKPIPKKKGRPTNAEIAARGAVNGSSGNASSTQAGSPSAGPSVPNAAAAIPAFPPEAIAPVLKFPYSIAAKKTGFQGFELSDTETQMLVPLVDACLKQYLPQVGGLHANLFMLLGSITVITAVRYDMYLDFKKEKAKEKAFSNPNPGASAVSTSPEMTQ